MSGFFDFPGLDRRRSHPPGKRVTARRPWAFCLGGRRPASASSGRIAR